MLLLILFIHLAGELHAGENIDENLKAFSEESSEDGSDASDSGESSMRGDRGSSRDTSLSATSHQLIEYDSATGETATEDNMDTVSEGTDHGKNCANNFCRDREDLNDDDIDSRSTGECFTAESAFNVHCVKINCKFAKTRDEGSETTIENISTRCIGWARACFFKIVFFGC